MSSKGPSPHLTWKELACKDGTPYPEQWRLTRAVILAEEFEAIRAFVGVPLVVTSGYRTPTQNALVGGAKQSQHVQGRALDLRVPKGWNVDEFFTLLKWRAKNPLSKLRGLGLYRDGHVHIDVRPTEKLVTWKV